MSRSLGRVMRKPPWSSDHAVEACSSLATCFDGQSGVITQWVLSNGTHFDKESQPRPSQSQLVQEGVGPLLILLVLEKLRRGAAPCFDGAGDGGDEVGPVCVLCVELGEEDLPVRVDVYFEAEDVSEGLEGLLEVAVFLGPVVTDCNLYFEGSECVSR